MDTERIWNTLAAHIQQEENTPEEERELQDWLQERPEHRTTYRALERFYKDYAGTEPNGVPDSRRAWEENRRRIARRKTAARRRIYRWTTVAASVVLMIGAGLYWQAGQKELQPQPVVAGAGTAIHPGSAKAVLTLASGKTLALGNSGEQLIRDHESVIRNENNILRYSPGTAGDPAKTTGTGAIGTPKAETGEALQYNSLEIPRGGEYQLVLEDGTRVWLNSETRLRYPVAFGPQERRIELEGEAYFQVAKDRRRPFIVCASGTDITALGTEFNVSSHNKSRVVQTTLVEGSVRVAAAKGGSCILQPSQQAICRPEVNMPEVKQVNTALYTSWKDGYYMFERQTLGEIMNTLARWYDIKVFFSNRELSDLRFSGRLKRYEDIGNFLAMIRLTNDVTFEIEDKTIIVKNRINRK